MSSSKDLKEGEAPVEPITPKAAEGETVAQVFIIYFFLYNFIRVCKGRIMMMLSNPLSLSNFDNAIF